MNTPQYEASYDKAPHYKAPHYIKTPCGAVQGIASEKLEHVSIYRGIRYATAGRFEYPKQVTSWEGVYDASQFGACSYQPRAFEDERKDPKKAFYYHEFREGEHYEYSDDCLFLNIWAPDDITEAPVLVYIHGGGFLGGCGHEKHFEGEAWCKRGMIVVTLNYRLGPMGFFCHPWLEKEDWHCGNYALFDQLTALHWVKENIWSFGGNPENITLMGQSAGAMSVQCFAVSPLAENLFTKAIMLSGGGVGALMDPGKHTTRELYPFWQKVATECGATSLEELKEMDAAIYFQAFQKIRKQDKASMKNYLPCRDEVILTQPGTLTLQQKKQKKIPYLTCSTSQDIVVPVTHMMSKRWVDKQRKTGSEMDSYCAFFQRQLPGDDKGAWHSSDLWYAFGGLKNCWRPFTKEDYHLSDQMIDYYSNFAKTGNPNGEELPIWEAAGEGQKRVMLLDVPSPHMGKASVWKMICVMFRK